MSRTTTPRTPRPSLAAELIALNESRITHAINVLRCLEAQGKDPSLKVNGYLLTTATDRKVWIHEYAIADDGILEIGRGLGAHTDFEAPNFLALHIASKPCELDGFRL